jgi:SRSO17 transposase
LDDCERRFEAYVGGLADALGHADRAAPRRGRHGLLSPGARKSVEPMAARMAPARVGAAHQSLHHFVAAAPWADGPVLEAARGYVLPAIQKRGVLGLDPRIAAWIVDDTGFAKQGRHSLRVARQYCGQLGKKDNCQVALSLSLANAEASLPVAYRLYLPEAWAGDPARRSEAGVPQTIRFQSKPQIALDQIRPRRRSGPSARRCAGRRGLRQRHPVWRRGLGARLGLCPGHPARDHGLGPGHGAVAGTGLFRDRPADGQATQAAQTRPDPPVGFAQGPGGEPAAWAAADRQLARGIDGSPALALHRPAGAPGASRHPARRAAPGRVVAGRMAKGEAEPTKFWPSSLPEDSRLEDLLAAVKLRWRIERDHRDLQQEIGLSHDEGRGWRGFHHHATRSIAAYGFLIVERCPIPPSGSAAAALLEEPAVPSGYRPRGSPDPAGAAHAKLDRHRAPASVGRPGPQSAAMPLLQAAPRTLAGAATFLTQ